VTKRATDLQKVIVIGLGLRLLLTVFIRLKRKFVSPSRVILCQYCALQIHHVSKVTKVDTYTFYVSIGILTWT